MIMSTWCPYNRHNPDMTGGKRFPIQALVTGQAIGLLVTGQEIGRFVRERQWTQLVTS